MTKPVKTFVAKVVDEYGGIYPAAFIAVLDWSESSQKTGSAKKHTDSYEIEQEVEGLSYQLMYWYDQGKVGQFKARPLMRENDSGEFTNVITADFSKPQVVAALQNTSDPIQGILNAIEVDVKHKSW